MNQQHAGQSLKPFNMTANLHGSARWMTKEELGPAGLLGGGVIIGETKDKQLLRFNGDGHMMVFAPTGAGKGIGLVQPNLVDYQGSMVVLDPKGENAIVSARRRREMGHSVFVLDPFERTGMKSTPFNPLGAISIRDEQNFVANIEAIAEALVPPTFEKDQHWTMGARRFIAFALFFMFAHEPTERRHLLRLFELIAAGREFHRKMAVVLAEGRHPDAFFASLCRAQGAWYLGREDREFSYFESVVLNNVGWIADGVWRGVLDAPPQAPIPLKSKRVTVYLVLPFHRLDRYRPWLRVMVAGLVAELYQTPGIPSGDPVLFMLDEAFAGLGKMDTLMNASAAVRGSGGRLCFVYQDLSQLKSLYRDSWESLIANSGVTLFWAVNDLEAAQYLSRRGGNETVPIPGNPVGMGRPLVPVDDVLSRPLDEVLAIFRGERMARFGRLNVRNDARFAGLLDRNSTYDRPAAIDPVLRAQGDWVPVDLTDVTNEEPDVDEVQAPAAPDASDPLFEELSAEFGKRIVRRGGAFGYVDERGFFKSIDLP